VLVKEGFDRASTNRIAEAAGVSIGSLYQYFPSKEALVAALVERHMERMSATLEAEMAEVATAPLELAVRRMVAFMLNAHAVDPALHHVLNEQVPRVGRLHKLHEIEELMRGKTRVYLELNRDKLRPQDLDVASFIVVQTIEALCHAATAPHTPRLDHDTLIEEVTQLIVRYLQRPDA
jgi:AcrR family transcriptional regulator